MGGDIIFKRGCLGHWGISAGGVGLWPFCCLLLLAGCFLWFSCDTGPHHDVHFNIYLKKEDKLKRTWKSVSHKEPVLFSNCLPQVFCIGHRKPTRAGEWA